MSGNNRIYIIIGSIILFFSILYFFGDNKYVIWGMIISYLAIVFFAITCLNALPAGKIKQATDSKLIFNIRPVLSWIILGSFGFIIGGIFVIYSLIAAFSLPAITNLSCERVMPPASEKIQLNSDLISCQLSAKSFFGRVMKNIEISQLTRATLKITYSDAGISYYDIILHDGDRKEITFDWHGDFKLESYEDLINKINTFIKNNSKANLAIIEDEREGLFFVFIFAIVFVSLFFLLANIAPNIYCVFEGESESFTLKRKRLFLLTTKTSKLDLNQIDRAVLEYGEKTSKISLILNYGEKLPLTYLSDSAGGKEEIVNAIDRFIKSYKCAQKIDLEKDN